MVVRGGKSKSDRTTCKINSNPEVLWNVWWLSWNCEANLEGIWSKWLKTNQGRENDRQTWDGCALKRRGTNYHIFGFWCSHVLYELTLLLLISYSEMRRVSPLPNSNQFSGSSDCTVRTLLLTSGVVSYKQHWAWSNGSQAPSQKSHFWLYDSMQISFVLLAPILLSKNWTASPKLSSYVLEKQFLILQSKRSLSAYFETLFTF